MSMIGFFLFLGWEDPRHLPGKLCPASLIELFVDMEMSVSFSKSLSPVAHSSSHAEPLWSI